MTEGSGNTLRPKRCERRDHPAAGASAPARRPPAEAPDRLGRPARAPVISAPEFVGREAEAAALAEALAGQPAVVLVAGEAGIGKTRLLQEVLARHSGGSKGSAGQSRSIVSVCPPFRRPYTLGPVVDALRQATGSLAQLKLSGLAGALRPLFPEWAEELPPAPEPIEDATAARHRLFRALSELLAGLDVAVLVVEDVHWADEATLEFLLFLRSQARGPSIVVTYRPEDLPADSLLLRLSSRLPAGTTGLRLTLHPLAVPDTVGLVSSMLDHRHVSQEFAEFLHQRTDGIPLAVEELVRLMHDRADLTQRDGEWVRRSLREIAVPATIRDGVLERTRRLSPDARAILDAAAVLVDPAAEQTLGAVAGLEAGRFAPALAEVLRCGLLAEDERGAVAFRHALACQAVYEATSPPQRRQLHLSAGRALEALRCPPIAQLTRHYRKANEPARWCYYAEQAADLALATGDEATASGLLQDMLAEADLSVSSVVRLVKKMPFASLTSQAPFRSLIGRLRAVLAAGVPEPAQEAQVRMLLGRLLLMVEDREAARDELARAIPGLPPGSVEAARAAGLLGWPTDTTSPATAHRKWLERAAVLAATLPPADRLNLTVQRAAALLMLGEEAGWAVAAEIPDDASGSAEQEYIVKGHMNVGNMAMAWWGRHEEARRRLTTALRLAEARGYLIFRGLILVTLAHLDWLSGAWDGLAERASALAGNEELHPLTRHEAILVRGLLHAAAGENSLASEELRQVLAEVRERATDQIMEPAAALARLLLAEGDATGALRVTEEPITILVRKGIWVWGSDLVPARAEALIAAGRAEDAAELTAAFGRGLGRRAAPAPQAALLLCRALVASGQGQHARAAALFGRAADAWQVPPRPYDALLARERQARALLAAGRGPAGLAILPEVVKGLSSLGARRDAIRVISTLNEHGVQARRPWLGGRRGYGAQLSPRERDVVRLLAGGRTNRQIAEVLFLSPKTVACHVYSAMRKLDVSSRAALVARALEAADSRPAAEAG